MTEQLRKAWYSTYVWYSSWWRQNPTKSLTLSGGLRWSVYWNLDPHTSLTFNAYNPTERQHLFGDVPDDTVLTYAMKGRHLSEPERPVIPQKDESLSDAVIRLILAHEPQNTPLDQLFQSFRNADQQGNYMRTLHHAWYIWSSVQGRFCCSFVETGPHLSYSISPLNVGMRWTPYQEAEALPLLPAEGETTAQAALRLCRSLESPTVRHSETCSSPLLVVQEPSPNVP